MPVISAYHLRLRRTRDTSPAMTCFEYRLGCAECRYVVLWVSLEPFIRIRVPCGPPQCGGRSKRLSSFNNPFAGNCSSSRTGILGTLIWSRKKVVIPADFSGGGLTICCHVVRRLSRVAFSNQDTSGRLMTDVLRNSMAELLLFIRIH